jgi:hypothetical protein
MFERYMAYPLGSTNNMGQDKQSLSDRQDTLCAY